MIETKEVIAFFDRLAPGWDADMVRSDEIINTILDNAGVTEGKEILDVACGTGVLIPDYRKRKAASVTGIDISPKMVELAREKFPQPEVRILCGDVETTDFRKLSGLLKPGGTLTVAHGMSREKIDAHHHGAASHVSNGLMPAEKLAAIFGKYLTVITVLSDDRMYQVVGENKTK